MQKLLILCLGLMMGPASLWGQDTSTFRIDFGENGPSPWNHLHFQNDPDHFQFAIVSDRTGGHRPGIFADAVAKLNLLQPEFVMSVGDLIEGYLEDTAKLNAQWREFDQLLAPLEMPFFYLPGNHDISNPVMRRLWEQRYGRRYYHFIYKDVLFLTLDTNDGEGVVLSKEQVAYVKAVLAQHPEVRWTLLFMHHPIWVYAPVSGFDEIEAALAGRNYTVFAGHTHQYLYSVRQDRNYYVLATTGGGSALRGPRFSEFDHVTWVTMDSAGPRILNLQLSGLLPHDVVDSTTYRQAQALIGAADFGHLVLSASGSVDWDRPDTCQMLLTIENQGDRPLAFSGRFFHHHLLDPTPTQLSATVAPRSTSLVAVEVTPRQARYLLAPDPLQLDWTLRYEGTGLDTTFALEGTYALTFAPRAGAALSSPALPFFLDTHTVTLANRIPGAVVHYTLDGSEPSPESPVYQAPLRLDETTTLKARLRYGDYWAGDSYEQTYERVRPRVPPRVKRRRQAGLRYAYAEGYFSRVPDFDTLRVVKEGVAREFDLRALCEQDDHYAIRYTGYIEVPATGLYRFETISDDGSRLYVDGQLVVDNDGSHSARRRAGHIALQKGVYPLRIDYFEDYESQTLQAFFGREGEALRPIWEAVTH